MLQEHSLFCSCLKSKIVNIGQFVAVASPSHCTWCLESESESESDSRVIQVWMDRVGSWDLDGLGCVGLDWIGLDYAGLVWFGLVSTNHWVGNGSVRVRYDNQVNFYSSLYYAEFP